MQKLFSLMEFHLLSFASVAFLFGVKSESELWLRLSLPAAPEVGM